MGLDSKLADYVETKHGAIINETGETTAVLESCDATILELNIIAHQIPPFVDTGKKLRTWFNSIIKKCIVSTWDGNNKYLILVADNYERVPVQKHAEQRSRHTSHMAAFAKAGYADISKEELDAMEVTDDTCPSSVHINASSTLLYKVLIYLIGCMTVEFANEKRFAMYVTCPSRKGAPLGDGKCSFGAGQNIRVTERGLEPPGTFVHGEGEVEAWLWTRVLREWGARNILIRSIDNDNIGIALAIPPEMTTGVYVELKPRDYDKPTKSDPKRLCLRGEKTRRYLDCGRLVAHIPDPHVRLSLLATAVFAGSDFCRPLRETDHSPIPGVSIGTLLPTFAELKLPLCIMKEDGIPAFDTERVYNFISVCYRKRKRRELSRDELKEYDPVIDSALFNISYWATLFKD